MPDNSMAVMSGWGMGICFQLFVSRLVLISKIDLVASGAEVWVDGYTVNH